MQSLVRRRGIASSSSLFGFSRCLSSSPRSSISAFSSSQTPESSSTVNADEIAFFSSLASEWWDERGEFAMLHRMNPARLSFVRDKIRETQLDDAAPGERMSRRRKVLSGMTALDVGCGGGLLSESLARLGAQTMGIDASSANISIAQLHASMDPLLASPSSLTYENTTSHDLVKRNQQYDVVCSMEVLEHVDNPSDFLHSCAALVKPGGHLFLSTLSRTPFSYLTNILLAESILRLVSPGTHTYSKFIRSSELIDFFMHPIPSLPSSSSHGVEKPWISRLYGHADGVLGAAREPMRTEAEVRSMVFSPFDGRWRVMPRGFEVGSGMEGNYLFWVRRPKE